MFGSIPNVIVKPSLLTPQHLEVTAENDLVVITVGNSTMKMRYEDALKISQWIRLRAKQAKAFVGDHSRHWSGLAHLEDLNVKNNPIF